MLSVGYRAESIGIMVFYNGQKSQIIDIWLRLREKILNSERRFIANPEQDSVLSFRVEEIDQIGIFLSSLTISSVLKQCETVYAFQGKEIDYLLVCTTRSKKLAISNDGSKPVFL